MATPTALGTIFNEATYAATERRRYDFHDHNGTPRGLLMAILDPLSRDPSERRTTIAYDRFQLLPYRSDRSDAG